MKTFIFDVMNSSLSYFGIAFLIALENIFPPIPSEVILTFGGCYVNAKCFLGI